MPTVRHTITAADGWVQIAPEGQDFMVESKTHAAVDITFQTSAPSASAPSHGLAKGEILVRTGAGAGSGDAYVSTPNTLLPVELVVTT